MVVLKQTGKGHRRKYKRITERVSGGLTAEPSCLFALFRKYENQKSTHQNIFYHVLCNRNVYHAF